jgi:hypothetical protein
MPRWIADVCVVMATAVGLGLSVEDPFNRVIAVVICAAVGVLVFWARPRRRRR